MVAMLVGDEDAIERLRGDAEIFQTRDDLARAQPAIHEEAASIGLDEGAIARAAATEDGETEHTQFKTARREFAICDSEKINPRRVPPYGSGFFVSMSEKMCNFLAS